jgi:hypothetical protein
MAEPELVEVARKRRGQVPPPWVVWGALIDPWEDPRRPWLDQLRSNERPPVILSSDKPSEVVWGSLWPEHPLLQIRFSIEPEECGSMLLCSLRAPAGSLRDDEVRQLRHRISYLINDSSGLRGLFGQ